MNTAPLSPFALSSLSEVNAIPNLSILLLSRNSSLIPQHNTYFSLTSMAMNLLTYPINSNFFVKLDKSNYMKITT